MTVDSLHIRLSFMLKSSVHGSTEPTDEYQRVWAASWMISRMVDYVIGTSIYGNSILIW